MADFSNLEIVQKGYEYFAKADIEGLLSLFSENINWIVPEIENAPFAGSREGIGSVGQFFEQLDKAEDITRFEPLEFIAQDDKVVVLGESAATVKSTGNSYETDWVHVFHLKDGKVVSFHEFFDNAAATKAFQKTSGKVA
jgi:ketosteroid isomerase-like protein